MNIGAVSRKQLPLNSRPYQNIPRAFQSVSEHLPAS